MTGPGHRGRGKRVQRTCDPDWTSLRTVWVNSVRCWENRQLATAQLSIQVWLLQTLVALVMTAQTMSFRLEFACKGFNTEKKQHFVTQRNDPCCFIGLIFKLSLKMSFCLCRRKPSIWICPQVSEPVSLCIPNKMWTLHLTTSEGNFTQFCGHRCTWVHKCADWNLGSKGQWPEKPGD